MTSVCQLYDGWLTTIGPRTWFGEVQARSRTTISPRTWFGEGRRVEMLMGGTRRPCSGMPHVRSDLAFRNGPVGLNREDPRLSKGFRVRDSVSRLSRLEVPCPDGSNVQNHGFARSNTLFGRHCMFGRPGPSAARRPDQPARTPNCRADAWDCCLGSARCTSSCERAAAGGHTWHRPTHGIMESCKAGPDATRRPYRSSPHSSCLWESFLEVGSCWFSLTCC